MYTIDLTNSLLLKMSLELLPVGHSISYSIPLKGSSQALPIEWISSFLKGEVTRTSMR